MTRFQEFGTNAAAYSIAAGLVVLVTFVLVVATKAVNVKVESRCIAQGGQVIVTPGEVSRCLLPAAR
jgi:hypothetical protein